MMNSEQLQINELSSTLFPKTWKVLESGLQEGVAPGFVVGLWQKKNPDHLFTGAFGKRRLIPSPQPMQVDTIFDLASVTKVFATATLAAVLIERGWLSWDTPLTSLLADYPDSRVQIRHLLSHTAGLVFWEPYWEQLKNELAPDPVYRVAIQTRQNWVKKWVLSSVPQAAPGESTVYSDISFLLLGFALEEITKMPLDWAVRRFVWRPMGVTRAYFKHVKHSADLAIQEQVAATEESLWRGGVLQGQVHDDNCWAMGGYGGHAGAFADVRDVLQLARALMSGFLSQSTLSAMWTPVLEPPGCSRTLGWDTPSGEASSTSQQFSPRSVGHLGYTGTSLWIDLEAELAVALLSNRVHPSRENQKIRAFRPLFHEALRLDLGF